jgi:hypothetical protein
LAIEYLLARLASISSSTIAASTSIEAALCLQKPLFFKRVKIRTPEKKNFAAQNLPESLNQD